MNATAQTALRKIPPPSNECDRKTYFLYVEAQIASACDFTECTALMAYYNCGVEELVGRIVKDRFADRLPKKRAGG